MFILTAQHSTVLAVDNEYWNYLLIEICENGFLLFVDDVWCLHMSVGFVRPGCLNVPYPMVMRLTYRRPMPVPLACLVT